MDSGAVMFGDNWIYVDTAEFIVGMSAILVAAFVFLRFATPIGMFLAGVIIAAAFLASAFDGNDLDPARLILGVVMSVLSFYDWYKNIRPRPDVHRNAIFGFGRRGAEESKAHAEREGTDE